jgi:serine/threonine-protein kinase
VQDVPDALQQVVSRGLAPRPEDRFATALEMAEALERAVRPATRAEVAAWVEELAGDVLRERAGYVAEVERSESEPTVLRTTDDAAVAAAESTQLSTMGVSRPVASRAKPSSRVLLVGALSLAALASAAWFASDLGDGQADVPVLRKSTGALAPAVAAIERPLPIAASASADAAAPATRPTAPAAPASRPAPIRPKPKPPCKYRDADGIWHIRPGCL